MKDRIDKIYYELLGYLMCPTDDDGIRDILEHHLQQQEKEVEISDNLEAWYHTDCGLCGYDDIKTIDNFCAGCGAKIKRIDEQQEKEQTPDLTGLQGEGKCLCHRREAVPSTGKATKEKIEKLDINMQNGLDWRDEIETKINEIILYLNQHT